MAIVQEKGRGQNFDFYYVKQVKDFSMKEFRGIRILMSIIWYKLCTTS